MSDTQTTTSAQGSPFWRFSLQFYRQPKVAEACIALQEDAGVDVNLLLLRLAGNEHGVTSHRPVA